MHEDQHSSGPVETVKANAADLYGFAAMLDEAMTENGSNAGSLRSCVIEQPQPPADYTGRMLMRKGGSLPTLVTAEGGNYLAIMMGATTGLTSALNQYLTLLTDVLADAAPAMRKIADEYLASDQASADALAATDPDGEIVAEPYTPGQSSDAFDYQAPSDEYQRIDNTLYAYDDPYAKLKGAGEWLDIDGDGPSEIKAFLMGFDIHVDGRITHFAGDWSGLFPCAKSLHRVATGLGSIGANIAQGNKDLGVTWEGSAASSAYGYFSGLAGVVQNMPEILNTAAGAYEQLSTQIQEIAPAMAIWIRNVLEAASWAQMAIPSGYGVLKEAGVGVYAGIQQGLAAGVTGAAAMLGIDVMVAAELMYFVYQYWDTGVVPHDLAAATATSAHAATVDDCAARVLDQVDALKHFLR